MENNILSLNWIGKEYAIKLINEPIKSKLKENKDWNNKEENKYSKNILIKGDNLEVLKHLLKDYKNKIKMIYIDLPYNTGNSFIYSDKKDINQFLFEIGYNENRIKNLLKNKKNKEQLKHAAWLTFMYPRLYIAKELLKEDGVIFISIDDNEVEYLKIIMNEIFGKENFIAQFIRKTGIAARLDATHISTEQDYILCYSKNLNINSFNKQDTNIDKGYIYKDKHYKTR